MTDTPASLRLKGPLSRDTGRMTQGRNAGIKRNRRPTGTKAIEKKIRIAADTEAAFDRARVASGNLSLSLYLELLAHQLEHDLGGLPVFSPALDGTEVHPTAAA